MPSRYLLPTSLFTRSATHRVSLVIVALGGLWLAVIWAVAIP